MNVPLPPPLPKRKRRGTGWLAFLLISIVVIWLLFQISLWLEPKGTAAKRGAWMACRQLVTERLKAPATATFQPFDVDNVSPLTLEPTHYRVHGTVDSQNAFGALIRTAYTCTVSPLGGDRWHLIGVELHER